MDRSAVRAIPDLTVDNVTGSPFVHVVAPETHPLWPRTPRGFR